MMIFSICVLVYPQVRNARLTGSAEVTYGVAGIDSDRQMDFNEDLLNVFLILGGVVQVVIGGLGLLVGYITVVHDFGNLWLTRVVILVGQLSWIPLLTGTQNFWIGKSLTFQLFATRLTYHRTA